MPSGVGLSPVVPGWPDAIRVVEEVNNEEGAEPEAEDVAEGYRKPATGM